MAQTLGVSSRLAHLHNLYESQQVADHNKLIINL